MANSKRKCAFCGERFTTESMLRHGVMMFCCFEHVIQYTQTPKAKKKGKGILEKEKRREHREKKAALKPKSKILAEAQASFNTYIRIRDYHEPCISCGKSREHVEKEQGWKTGGCWDAGHFMTRGAKGQLRFVLYNVHKQCKSCNGGGGKFSHKAATVDEQYRTNLIEKIGLEKVELLESNNEIDTRKNDVEYLERIKKIFNRRARWYKKRRDI